MTAGGPVSHLDSLFSLASRTVLVTGAGRGVGAGIAATLARAGARVAVNDLHADRAEQTADALSAEGLDVSAHPFDVTDVAGTSAGIAGVRAALGSIDVLVHNAGVLEGGGRSSRFVDMPPEDWQAQIDLNLAAMMRLCQAVLPGQIEQGWGRIVQISSGAASVGLGIGVGAYGAAKAGAEGLVRHLAVEYAGQGVTANSLALGLMEGVGRGDEAAVEKMIRRVPIGRLGRGSDVGAAVLWLASDAGSLVTGQVIHLNGGTLFGR